MGRWPEGKAGVFDMTSAKATVVAPTTMLAIGLIFILLASLAVVQTQSVTVSPVQSDLSSLFETKTGQLTLQAPPYCGRFDIFCFVIFILRSVLARLVGVFGFTFGGVPGGGTATATAGSSARAGASASAGSTCAAGRAGRDCRRAERQEARDARQQARDARRAARR